jgi:hypothetical protein
VVWNITPLNRSSSIRSAFESGHYTTMLKTMRPMPSVVDYSRSVRKNQKPLSSYDILASNVLFYLKFDLSSPQVCGPVKWSDSTMYVNTATFKVSGKTGSALRSHSYSHPLGSEIDFKSIQPSNVPKSMLIRWLNVRGIHTPSQATISKKKIVDTVKQALGQGDRCRIQPTSSDHTNYSDYLAWNEVIRGYDSGETIRWTTSLHDTIKVVQDLPSVDDRFIDSNFGLGRSGVKKRAHTRVSSGHYILHEMKYAKCKILLEGKDTGCHVFYTPCLASVKSTKYGVMTLFREDNLSYIECPFSRCSCPAGRLFCSHMLGELEILYLTQVVGSNISSLLPRPIEEITEPVPIEYYLEECYRRKGQKDVMRKMEDQMKNKDIQTAVDIDSVEDDGEVSADDDNDIAIISESSERTTEVAQGASDSLDVNETEEFLRYSPEEEQQKYPKGYSLVLDH